MSVNIRYEVQLLFLSFCTGVFLMMCYDFFRIFRIFCPHRAVWVGIEDVAYWIYAGFVSFSLLYKQNDGGLRAYAVAGIFAGMLAYDKLVSRFFLKYLKKFRKYLRIKLEKCLHHQDE